MKLAVLLGLAFLVAPGGASAQPLRVYSEFVKIDAAGNVVAPESPREILSPAIARNAFATFQIVIQVPPDTPYTLRMGLNPENAVKYTFYRETDEKTPDGPRLEAVSEYYEDSVTRVIWLDLWMDKDAPVRRIKVEPQLFINDDWVIYPMEMRVRDPQVPDSAAKGSGVLEPFAVMQAALCRKPLPVASTPVVLTAASLRYRNALQDLAFAESAVASDKEEMKKRLGGCEAKVPASPETYLRVRDYFFTPLWMKVKGN
ncbi:MAG: hypothetical protein ABL967_12435 [Bryobacteraceae bacterium]